MANKFCHLHQTCPLFPKSTVQTFPSVRFSSILQRNIRYLSTILFNISSHLCYLLSTWYSNKMSAQITKLSRKKKIVSFPSPLWLVKVNISRWPLLVLLTQTPFLFPLKLPKIIILLCNEPDEIETLYIRIKYVPSTQNEQCIIYH